MSKLALMAAEEDSQPKKIANGGPVQKIDSAINELTVVRVQELVYEHIHGTIIGSLDREAETLNCMTKFGNHISDMTALRQLLENGLNMIIDHTVLSIEQLIDVLTLIDIQVDPSEGAANIGGREFILALSALDAAAPTLKQDRFETLLQLIWKRCYIYDDWAKLKLSSKQSDAARSETLRGTTLWFTIRYGLDANIFDSDSSKVRILAPIDCLGSACQPEDFSYRFTDEDLLMPILHDCKIQDEILQGFISDRRLDEVAVECLRDAQVMKEVQDAARAEMAQDLRALDIDATENSLFENVNGLYLESNGYGEENGYAHGEYAEAGDSEMF
jgi:nuclear pore complex protein Nup133